jgi:hypothetical protein
MKKISSFLFLFMMTTFVIAQSPGYMGKHFVLHYAFNFFPTVGPTTEITNRTNGFNLLFNGGFVDAELVGLNKTHAFELDCLYHKRKAICFNFQYGKTGIDYPLANVQYDGSLKTPAIVQVMGIGIGIKSFKRENIAPYGPYVKWEAMMLLNKITYNNTNWSIPDPMNANERLKVNQGKGKILFNVFAIGFSWGKQRIFFDKLVLDRGVKLGVVPKALWIIQDEQSQANGNAVKLFEEAGIQRIFARQLINFHLGIGFLAF